MTLEREFFEVTLMLNRKKRMLEKFSSPTFSELRIRLRTEIDTLETREVELYLMIEA